MNAASREVLLKALRQRIGCCITRDDGQRLQLHDVLAAEALLVFAIDPAASSVTAVQLDLHGDPRRRAREYCSYPAFTEGASGDDHTTASPWAKALLAEAPTAAD